MGKNMNEICLVINYNLKNISIIWSGVVTKCAFL